MTCGKLGFVEMKSTPFMFRSMGLGSPFCRAVACRIILTDLRVRNWQTFGRLRFESNQAMQRKSDLSSPQPMFITTRMITRYEI